MKTEGKRDMTRSKDVWIFVQHREGNLDREAFGLIPEAKRIISESGDKGIVTAVVLGPGLVGELETLGAYGSDRVLYDGSSNLERYHGELFAEVLYRMVKKYQPSYFLMSHNAETADLSARLAALLETALVSRAVDLVLDEAGRAVAIRPVANGYLFQKLMINTSICPIICFLPSVLNEPGPSESNKIEIITERTEIPLKDLRTKLKDVMKAAPEELDIKEADIIIAGGRGAGREESFNIIHELARVIEGSVGGTRPVIDSQILPFDRQIGQTGKTVVPQLLFACGISGANEFTAGMERSRLVIAVNKDPNARIFRFSDLGIIGDVHEVVPLLIERLKKMKESN